MTGLLHGRLTGDRVHPGVYRVGEGTATIGRTPHDLVIAGARAALPPTLFPLASGDVISVDRAQHLRVLYRRGSPSNALFLTNRCQNRCVFCSQPPTAEQDDHLVEEVLAAIPLLDPATQALGITGGEPTLCGDGLLAVLQSLRHHLPATALHLLSNGRRFAWLGLAEAVRACGNQDLMVGIPLCAEVPDRHDAATGAAGSWGETIRGMLNLARCGIPVEVRIVITCHNAHALENMARWIGRNLPFAAHVAWMGLEVTGWAARAEGSSWVEPAAVVDHLRGALRHLQRSGIRTSIYNLPYCHLPADCWDSCVPSISDWKRHLPTECQPCRMRSQCTGLFATGSRLIPAPVP